jgi:Tol biopolymer transport system component
MTALPKSMFIKRFVGGTAIAASCILFPAALAAQDYSVPHDSSDWHPMLSPDGLRIAYTAYPPGLPSEIFIMNADGTDVRRMTDNASSDERPNWSPDGSHLLFNSNRGENWDIYLMDVETGAIERLTFHEKEDLRASFMPDGRRIVFDSDRTGNDDIFIMERDSGEASMVQLTSDEGFDGYPEPSPDGRSIAYTSGSGGNKNIWLMDTDGGHKRQLTEDPGMDQAARFSPDGGLITFFSNRDGGHSEIYVMNADGSRKRRLTFALGFDFMPSFSPDGKLIAYDSQQNGRRAIYLMNADGSNPRQISNRPESLLAHEIRTMGAIEALTRYEEVLGEAAWREAPAGESTLARMAEGLLASDPDGAYSLIAAQVRAYPLTRAREEWVHPHLEALLPLIEGRVPQGADGISARLLLADVQLKLGRLDEASEGYDAVLALEAENAHARDRLAHIADSQD